MTGSTLHRSATSSIEDRKALLRTDRELQVPTRSLVTRRELLGLQLLLLVSGSSLACRPAPLTASLSPTASPVPPGTPVVDAPVGQASPVAAVPSPPPVETPDQPCSSQSGLSTHLIRLIEATDRARYASSLGLDYQNGKVKVAMLFRHPDVDVSALVQQYNLVQVGHFGNFGMAFASPDDLCALASDPDVVTVAMPPVPATTGN
jgi:hypothetical protein